MARLAGGLREFAGHKGFLARRGLIAVVVGGAVAETTVLQIVAPAARPLGTQSTALPPLAGYHDLRWLFTFGLSWPAFFAVVAAMLLARALTDAALVLLAWPEAATRPHFVSAFKSCAALTLVCWLVLSPVVTLMFGVALVPFSWPFLAAVPILLWSAIMLSHGGVLPFWWGRLPAASAAGWLLAGFLLMSAVAALSPRLNVAEFLAVTALAGLANARAWYGVTIAVSAIKAPRFQWAPVAPVAAMLVIALVIGLARLTFTGTVHLAPEPEPLAGGSASPVAAAGALGMGTGNSASGPVNPAPAPRTGGKQASHKVQAAVLVVAGWGSNCCNDADGLAAAEPDLLVRQFSYVGLSAAGQPVSYHRSADLPIQQLGDRMAAQVQWLHAHTHTPVDIVAESEGTLGLYAMLARHSGLPIKSIVMLSPIVEPAQVGRSGVPGDALITLNDLIGTLSPYGRNGAEELLDSVSQVGWSYFQDISRERSYRWLAVVPLADAVTMSPCPYPPNLVIVDAFHGGLLGDATVRGMVTEFLNGTTAVPYPASLRSEAQVIAAAAVAWRMPDLHPVCPAR